MILCLSAGPQNEFVDMILFCALLYLCIHARELTRETLVYSSTCYMQIGDSRLVHTQAI